MTSILDCKFVNLPKVSDSRGNLSFIESNIHIPFDIKRVYYIYDVPGGSERGSHSQSYGSSSLCLAVLM